jgi:hypothetical protein
LGGPFKDESDFFKFLDSLGVNSKEVEEGKIPITTDVEYNFRITSTGQFGKSSREIIAIVYDFDRVKSRLGEALQKDEKKPDEEGTGGTPPPTSPADDKDEDKGKDKDKKAGQPSTPSPAKRPRVVYWKER